jgi:hypothetical protein
VRQYQWPFFSLFMQHSCAYHTATTRSAIKLCQDESCDSYNLDKRQESTTSPIILFFFPFLFSEDTNNPLEGMMMKFSTELSGAVITSLNSLACCNMFKPVVPSRTSKISCRPLNNM